MADLDGFAPVKGKCTFWRQRLSADDEWDPRVKKEERRVDCACFVEGKGWQFTVATIPSDCPDKNRCRYHIKHC